MKLTTFTDYTIRTLVYLALHPDRFVTIREIAAAHRVSANHLMKVGQSLSASGDVLTLRGPHGGMRLARPAADIRLGDVVRRTEPEAGPPIGAGTPAGLRLAGAMAAAVTAFLTELDRHSIADLAAGTSDGAGEFPIERMREVRAIRFVG